MDKEKINLKVADADSYVSEPIVEEVISGEILKNTWFRRDVTYKLIEGSSATVNKISILGGAVTDICEDGEAGNTSVATKTIRVDKKVSEIFDGCFTTAQVADKNFENALNTEKLYSMASVLTNYANEQLVAAAKESSIDYSGLTAHQYFIKRLGEYQKQTKTQAGVAKVSADFWADLQTSGLTLQNNFINDPANVPNGYVGSYQGVTVVLDVMQEENLILFQNNSLVMVTPVRTTDVQENIIGDYTDIEGFDFINGLLSLHETDARKGIIHTWLHKFFGMGVANENLVIKDKATTSVPKSKK